MPIASTDIVYLKSANDDSEGGAVSVEQIEDATLQNLFESVAAADVSDGLTTYKKIFAKNNHGSINWQNVVAWISQITPSEDDEISIGIGSSNDTDGSNVLSAFTANAVVAVISSDASDVREVTLVGENAAGARVTEVLTLTGLTQVVGSQVFSKLYLAYVSSVLNNVTISIRQGSGGTVRGTIGSLKYSAILYNNPLTKAAGFELGNINFGNSQALWLRRIVAAGANPYSSNSMKLKLEGESV